MPAAGAPAALRRWAARAPALAALALFGLFLVRLPRLVDAISWNADALAPALIAERAGAAADELDRAGTTVLGDISSASTLGFHLLTQSLPGHRTLWEYTPAVVALCTALLVAWSCRRLAGRWAALLGGCLVFAAGSDALLTFLAPAFRGPTWFSSALAAALLVAWWRRAGEPKGVSVLLAVVAAPLVGMNLASDPLLWLSGVLPLVVAPVAVWWWDRRGDARRVAALAVGTAVGAGVVAFGAQRLLAAGDFVTRRQEFGGGYLKFAPPDRLVENIALAGRGVLALAGVPGMGGQADGLAPLRWIVAVFLLAGIVAAVVPVLRRPAPAAGASQAAPPPATGRARSVHLMARRAYLTFWGVAAGAVALGYVMSDIPSAKVVLHVPGDRYLVPLLLAVVAVIPVVLHGAGTSGRRRVGAGVAAACLVAGAAVGMVRGDIENAQRSEMSAQAAGMAAWLDEMGVDRGYAGYWNAGPLSYHTGLRVLAVRPCMSGPREALCPVALNGSRSWYRPASDFGSFVVVDDTSPGDIATARAWRADFGRPAEIRRFGSMLVRVYPYDVAARLAPGWRPYADERLATRAGG